MTDHEQTAQGIVDVFKQHLAAFHGMTEEHWPEGSCDGTTVRAMIVVALGRETEACARVADENAAAAWAAVARSEASAIAAAIRARTGGETR